MPSAVEQPTHEVIGVYSADRIVVAGIDDGNSVTGLGAPEEVMLSDVDVFSTERVTPSEHAPQRRLIHFGATEGDADGGDHQPDDVYPVGDAFGGEARDYLRRHFLGRRVALERVGRSGRVVSMYRERDGTSPALALLSQGLAKLRAEATRGTLKDWQAALQRAAGEAKAQRRGMFSLRPVAEVVRPVSRFPLTAAQSVAHATATGGGMTGVDAASSSPRRGSGKAPVPPAVGDDSVVSERQERLVATLVGQIVLCCVEDVSDMLIVRLVTSAASQELFLRLAGVFLFQGSAFATHSDDARALLRARLLHRQVSVTIAGFDQPTGHFVGGFTQQCQPLEWLLAHGRLAVDRRTLPLCHRAAAFDAHERLAVQDARGAWAPGLAQQRPGFLADLLPFAGIVTAVHAPNLVAVTPLHPAPDADDDGEVEDAPSSSRRPAATSAGGRQPRLVRLAFLHFEEPGLVEERDVGRVIRFPLHYLHGRDQARGLLRGARVDVNPIALVPGGKGSQPLTIAQLAVVPQPPPPADGDTAPVSPPAAVDAAELIAAHTLCHLRQVHLAPLALALQPPATLVEAARVGGERLAALGGGPDGEADENALDGRYRDAQPTELQAAPTAPSDRDDESSDGDVVSPVAARSLDPDAAASTPTTNTHADAFAFGLTHSYGSSEGFASDLLAPAGDESSAPAQSAKHGAVGTAIPVAAEAPPEQRGPSEAHHHQQHHHGEVMEMRHSALSFDDSICVLVPNRERHALSQLKLPLHVPLAASVESVEGGVLALHLFAQCVLLPVTVAGVAIPPGFPAAEEALAHLLHSTVDVVITRLSGDAYSGVVLVSPPPAAEPVHQGGPRSVAVELLSAGLGIARGLASLVLPEDAAVHHAAEQIARERGVGLWHAQHVDRTRTFVESRDRHAAMPLTALGHPSDRPACGSAPGMRTFFAFCGFNFDRGTLMVEDTAGVKGMTTPNQVRLLLQEAANRVPNFQVSTAKDAAPCVGRRALVAAPAWHGVEYDCNDTSIQWLRADIDAVMAPAGGGEDVQMTVRAVDDPLTATLAARHVFILHSEEFNAWRGSGARRDGGNGADDGQPKTRASEKSRRGGGGIKRSSGNSGRSQGKWATDESVARALAMLLDTPAVLKEVRIAGVEVDQCTERVMQCLDVLRVANDQPLLPRAVVAYVRFGIPYVHIFQPSEAPPGPDTHPFAFPLLARTSDAEVFVDVGLLDHSPLAAEACALLHVARAPPVPFAAGGDGAEQQELESGGASAKRKATSRQRRQGKRSTFEASAAPTKPDGTAAAAQEPQPPRPAPPKASAAGSGGSESRQRRRGDKQGAGDKPQLKKR